MEYYNKKESDILKELDTSLNGINSSLIDSRISKYGKNIIEEAKGKTHLQRFLEQFKDMMIIVLIIVAVVMGIYGILYSHDYTDTIVISVVVLINAIMGFIQEEKAEVTLKGLKKYSASTCKVKRDGNVSVINSEDLVPGDIIILEAGDKVPADARILTSSNLKIDESPLTGESNPVKKFPKVLVGKNILQHQVNMVFSGSNVVNGTSTCVVVRTGMLTELGRIAVSLNTPYEVLTPLQIKMKEISKKLTLLVFLIIIFMFLYGVLNNYKAMEIIMLCSSLAVAAIPEGLPAVITIALSTGANTLAKKKTIVRQMSAVETLGSMDIICSDKTGTITQNKMSVEKINMLDENMMYNAMILANDAIIYNDKFVGDPTETSLLDYLKDKIDINSIRENYKRIISAPFDSERKVMSSVNIIDDKTYILVKGSIENLLTKCSYIIEKNKKEKLNKSYIDKIKNEELKLAENALRVMGFAYKELKTTPNSVDDVLDEENNLIYVGLVGIIDPPRTDVNDAVKKCLNAGIRPIMITGDSLITACSIARTVGIIKNNNEGILGSELDKYSDDELVSIVKKYNVYARVNPEHKTRIVKAWQKNGKVVAMTGDGVNDAPAIKDAHVGVGMGITGTEVTKSVADIILLDDSFSTIVDAVEEGRRIFTNIENNVVYSLSSNFAELFIVLIAMFTGQTILLPIHILFIDLITDTIPSICLSFEKSEKNIMNKKPRGIDKPIFTPFIISSILYSAIIETIMVLITYFVSLKMFSTNTAVSLALFSVVVQEILYAISCRNLKEYSYKQGILSNKAMNIGLVLVSIIELLVFLTPIGSLIHIEKLNINILIIVFIFNILGLIIYELGKPILKKLFKD